MGEGQDPGTCRDVKFSHLSDADLRNIPLLTDVCVGVRGWGWGPRSGERVRTPGPAGV
jgi:hypothetical protein